MMLLGSTDLGIHFSIRMKLNKTAQTRKKAMTEQHSTVVLEETASPGAGI